MFKKRYILFFLFSFCVSVSFSQETIITQKGVEFPVRIKVYDENKNIVTKDVEIYVNGRIYNLPDVNGRYIVRGKVGDDIRISHPEFETIYYTLTSSEDLKIIVENSKNNSYSKTKELRNQYVKFIDSAKFYKKKDIEKSLSFIEKALLSKETKSRNAATYFVLADIYSYWKQYDLAEYNYKLSNQIQEKVETQIAIANTQFLLKKYDESQKQYQELLSNRLSSSQKIEVFESLGDVFFAKQKWNNAKSNYNEALSIAKSNSITPKITDLNSKLADVFAAEGNVNTAENLFKKSMNLAEKESPVRALKEEEKTANFYNATKRFDDEIALRKKSLQRAKTNEFSSVKVEEKDSITPQKINYKIGSAYLQKEDYQKAIPFLEQSKKEANANNDIIVQKDATRKISEVFANLGENKKALENYKEYVALVDSLYVKKEQEIQQVKRFSKRIADNQNRITSLEKDKELAESKINLAYIDQKLSEESNRKQRILIYSLFGGLFLVLLLAYFMYRTNKQQKLANNLLALKSMRSQMNPHFIFNALNSVNSFIAVNDERNANRYLSEFSVLMRAVLENSDEDFIPLTKEMELLELYVKLEHNRFKEKFDYQISVDEKIDLEAFLIPPMLLQPYIENAIWHGLRYKEEKGNLEISILQKDEETISITIKDDGIGRAKSQALKTKNQLKQKSKGMSNIKNRIAILNDMYKERISVHISNVSEDGEGTKVELLLKKN